MVKLDLEKLNAFLEKLEGKEGCNFREENGEPRWDCDTNKSGDRLIARRILKNMNIDEDEIKLFISECNKHGGYCDCEILWNAIDGLKGFYNERGGGIKVKIGRIEINWYCHLCGKRCKVSEVECIFSTNCVMGVYTILGSIFFVFLSAVKGLSWYFEYFFMYFGVIGMLVGSYITLKAFMGAIKLKMKDGMVAL